MSNKQTESLFYQVGQEVNSYDCGFFSGYVVSQWNETGRLNFRMSREKIYKIRDWFRRPTGGLPKFYQENLLGRINSHTGPHKTGTGAPNATYEVSYLNFLGASGYFHDALFTKDEDLIRRVLRRTLPVRNRAYALLATIWSDSHWIAVFDRDPNDNTYYKYDSGWLKKPYGDRIHEDELIEVFKKNYMGRVIFRKDEYPKRREFTIPGASF